MACLNICKEVGEAYCNFSTLLATSLLVLCFSWLGVGVNEFMLFQPAA
jgi:hypothetical protein